MFNLRKSCKLEINQNLQIFSSEQSVGSPGAVIFSARGQENQTIFFRGQENQTSSRLRTFVKENVSANTAELN